MSCLEKRLNYWFNLTLYNQFDCAWWWVLHRLWKKRLRFC